jgi:hypothetical protein
MIKLNYKKINIMLFLVLILSDLKFKKKNIIIRLNNKFINKFIFLYKKKTE